MGRSSQGSIKRFSGHCHQARMSYPCAIKSPGRLQALVFAYFRISYLVDLRILATGNEGCHTAYGVGVASMACLNHQLSVSAHEWDCHGDLSPVRKHKALVVVELLDHAEYIVPSTGIQSGRVILELKQDLVHFECSENGFDQHRRSDSAALDIQPVLREVED